MNESLADGEKYGGAQMVMKSHFIRLICRKMSGGADATKWARAKEGFFLFII